MPDARRQVLGGPRHDGDVEDGLVAAALELAQDEHVVVLVHQVLAGLTPTEKTISQNVAGPHASTAFQGQGAFI